MITIHSFVTAYLLLAWNLLIFPTLYFCIYSINSGNYIEQNPNNATHIAVCVGSPFVYENLSMALIIIMLINNLVFTLSHMCFTEKSTLSCRTTFRHNILLLRKDYCCCFDDANVHDIIHV